MRIALAAATLLCPVLVQAAPVTKAAGSHMDVYYSNLDFEVSSGGEEGSIDGDGGGLDFWLGNGIGLFTAEFQKNNLDGNEAGFALDADSRVLRVGMGYRFVYQPNAGAWLRAEYINFDGDIAVEGIGEADDSQNGYGIHFGGLLGQGMVRGYGEIGFVDLDDLDGMEYTVGLNIQPGMVGGFVEYRVTDLELDDVELDEKFEDVRIGVRVAFD